MGTAELGSRQKIQRRTTGGRFYFTMAVHALLLSVVAFVPSVLRPAGRNAPPGMLDVAHGFLCLTWLAVFIAQTRLASRNLALHRQIGSLSSAIAALVVITG